ncbi:hypothetical protein G7Y89_g11264 [Cudoniella acicularis]|uniref:Uncharacterized protein n=1 Tax=Cudoniella acicularis TaxID=354080 RepID=A0A8H4VY04_9HELO|nr:hypothetical protein G7Y89_g11264 [Cudoniella acicularis]
MFKRFSFKRTQTAEKVPCEKSTEEVSPDRKFTTELRETGYITEAALKAKLVDVFGPGDYRISTKQERWIYHAPRKLEPEEMK